MPGLNAVSITRANIPLSTAMILKPPSANVLQTLYTNSVGFQQSTTPIFLEVPNRVDRVYAATDGKTYFIPQAKIANRTNRPDQPDIFIDHQAGKYTLMVTFDVLHHPATMGATPLPIDGFGVSLQPSPPGTAIALTQIQVLPAPDGQTSIMQKLFAQGDVDLNTVLAILQSDPNAWFEVHANAYYRVQSPSPFPPPPQPYGLPPRTIISPARALASPMFSVDPNLLQAPPPPPTDLQKQTVLLTTDQKDGVKGPFPPTNPANRPIYAKVDPTFGSNPDATWERTPDGLIKDSGIPNQYYILPDSYALAFDVAAGLPKMSVILRTEGGPSSAPPVYRVRVRFVIMPELDSARLESLRGRLRAEQGLAYADLVIGGYDKALFRPTHLFDQLGLTVVDGTAAPTAQEVDASGSFELVLDCTMEVYTLLTKLLIDPHSDGLEGTVAITLKTDTNPAFEYDVPARLRLDVVANHPLITRLETGDSGLPTVSNVLDWLLPSASPAASPTPSAKGPSVVVISNPSQVEVTVDQVLPTLLVMDEHMPYAYLAAPAVPTPPALDVPAGAEGVKVTLTPPASFPLWSAVAVDFAKVNLKFNPKTVLDRIHQLATSTDLATSVHVSSYLLQHPDQIPHSLAGLVGIHVQVQKWGEMPIDARLLVTAPEQTVQVSFTLSDLVAGMAPGQPTLLYRCRNILATGEATEWSPWQTNTGHDLLVFPVGV